MRNIKRAAVASACAIGASVAMISPASAATATASYNCGTYGNPVGVTFTRTGTALSLTAGISFFSPGVPAGGIVATLNYTGSPAVPSQGGITNPTAVPFGPRSSITLTKASSAPLPRPPSSIVLVITPPPLPTVTVTCTLLASPAPAGWGTGGI